MLIAFMKHTADDMRVNVVDVADEVGAKILEAGPIVRGLEVVQVTEDRKQYLGIHFPRLIGLDYFLIEGICIDFSKDPPGGAL